MMEMYMSDSEKKRARLIDTISGFLNFGLWLGMYSAIAYLISMIPNFKFETTFLVLILCALYFRGRK